MSDLAREFAEAVRCAARVPALEAEVRELRNLVEKLVQERESAATAARNGHAGARMLRMPDVKALTGLSRPTIYRRMNDGEFPRQVSLGGAAVAWREAEVQQWLADQGR